jgi:hypothetical protein
MPRAPDHPPLTELEIRRLAELAEHGPTRHLPSETRGRLALYKLIDETPEGWSITALGLQTLTSKRSPFVENKIPRNHRSVRLSVGVATGGSPATHRGSSRSPSRRPIGANATSRTHFLAIAGAQGLMLRRCVVKALRHLPLAPIATHVVRSGLSLIARATGVHLRAGARHAALGI